MSLYRVILDMPLSNCSSKYANEFGYSGSVFGFSGYASVFAELEMPLYLVDLNMPLRLLLWICHFIWCSGYGTVFAALDMPFYFLFWICDSICCSRYDTRFAVLDKPLYLLF
jgi:hypothetical protein